MGLDNTTYRAQEGLPLGSSSPTSMLDVITLAQERGLTLRGVKGVLADVLATAWGPWVAHLDEPNHFLLVLRASPQWIQVLDRGQLRVLERARLEERYSGHALILDQAQFGDGRPCLQVLEFHHEFQVAGVGQTVRHTFTVRNCGAADIQLSGQRSSCCGGVSVSIPTETLRAGDSTEVAVEFTVTRSGEVMKSAKLLTTDPTQPVVFLTLHGKVPHDLRAHPDRMHIADDKGACPTRSVTITGPPEMEITEVNTERGLLLTQLGEPTVDEDEKKLWTLTVSLKDESFVGEIADTINIKTTHRERPLITIPVTGIIRGDVRIDPPSVFFGFVKPGAEAKQEVVIQSRSGAEFTVTRAECKTAGVTVGAPRQRQDGAWVISVSVRTAKAGVVDAAITVTTGVKGEETLTIPVYAHVTEGE